MAFSSPMFFIHQPLFFPCRFVVSLTLQVLLPSHFSLSYNLLCWFISNLSSVICLSPLLSLLPICVYYFHKLSPSESVSTLFSLLFLFDPFFSLAPFSSCLFSLSSCLSLIPVSGSWPVPMNNGIDAAHLSLFICFPLYFSYLYLFCASQHTM